MTVRKIRAGRVPTATMDQFVGDVGTLFYDENTGEMRLSNGVEPGGNVVSYVLPVSSNIVLGGIRIGDGLAIDANGVVTVTAVGNVNVSSSTLEIDGGSASTNYTAEIIVDGGVA